MPSMDTHDPNFKRLRYIRYADDFVIGIVGSMKEARGIMKAIRTFTETELNLSINEEKSRVSKTAILGPNSLTGFWIQDVKAVSLMPGGPALSGK